LVQHLVAKSLTEETGSVQIDSSTKKSTQFFLKFKKTQSNSGAGDELNKHINIACGQKVVAQNGSEQSQATNIVRLAKGRDYRLFELDSVQQHRYQLFAVNEVHSCFDFTLLGENKGRGTVD